MAREVAEQLRRSGVGIVVLLAHAVALYGLSLASPGRMAVQPTSIAAYFLSEPGDPPAPTSPLDIRIDAPLPELHQPIVAFDTAAAPSARALLQASLTPPQQTARHVNTSAAPKPISVVEYIRQPQPRYPPQSRRLREQGTVVLRVIIDEHGRACDIGIETSSGHERLDRAAKEAVARAEFRPYVEDGSPRRALVFIPIEFALNAGRA